MNTLKKVQKALQGKKTYVLAGLGAVTVFVGLLGYLTPEQVDAILQILAPLAALTLAAKVNRLGK